MLVIFFLNEDKNTYTTAYMYAHTTVYTVQYMKYLCGKVCLVFPNMTGSLGIPDHKHDNYILGLPGLLIRNYSFWRG